MRLGGSVGAKAALLVSAVLLLVTVYVSSLPASHASFPRLS
jgi:hypothetical protein